MAGDGGEDAVAAAVQVIAVVVDEVDERADRFVGIAAVDVGEQLVAAGLGADEPLGMFDHVELPGAVGGAVGVAVIRDDPECHQTILAAWIRR